MPPKTTRSWQPSEFLPSLVVLAVLVAYTYAFLFQAPYTGFYFNPSNGEIMQLYLDPAPVDGLQVGDFLKQVGEVSWERFSEDSDQPLFVDILPSQTVDITVSRGGTDHTIRWTFPGLNRPEFMARFINLWWLAVVFWFFGMATQMFMRPKDVRWRLLSAICFATCLWLIMGCLSSWQIWASSLLLHALTWLGMPLYLHLHWIFPKPLGRIPGPVWVVFYILCSILAVAQFLQILPKTCYIIPFLLMLGGSLVLLGMHYLFQAQRRRDVGFLVFAILVAAAPSVSLGVTRAFGDIHPLDPLALLALPIMPGAYFYAIYRQKLGGLELRTNRLISLLIYGVLLLTISMPAAFVINAWSNEPGVMVTLGLAFTLIVCLVTAKIYPTFQRWIERRVLGMPMPPTQILEQYVARIITSMEWEQLEHILREEVFPSLLIRQALLLHLDDVKEAKPIFFMGIRKNQIPEKGDLDLLRSQSGKIRPMPGENTDRVRNAWVRVVLPLVLEEKTIGLCLLGRRDPDDVYHVSELSILQALMDQTALALKNIEQANDLHALYKVDIERQEAERTRLARELHDDVLGEMALLSMNIGDMATTPQFNDAYSAATEHIRQIINGLRPTMLSYGLWCALDELFDGLSETEKRIGILIDLPPSEERYPEDVELHLFRIMQQACQNALEHSHAITLYLTGSLKKGEISLILKDDGEGFAAGDQLDLPGLLMGKHFGLAGMYERAALVDARLTIESDPEHGTSVNVYWHEEAD